MTEKLFYADSHMASFTAVVTDCRKNGERFEVELDRTAFFPEGGGQYADRGTLDEVRVLDVQEKEGRIFHMTESPLEIGKTVEGQIDWDERFMKMQQHTGEHIVSGLVHSRFGYNNVGFHLGSEDCTMDFDGEITREELTQIELEANQAVWKNIEIRVLYPGEEELKTISYRSKIEIEGQVRLVEIPGYDMCACCAPHVERTGEIGVIKLVNVQRYKGGARVTMLCGVRALTDYSLRQGQTDQVSAMLCVKTDEISEAVSHLQKEISALKYENGEKEKILAIHIADSVPEDEDVVCLFPDSIGGDSMRTVMNRVLENGHRICGVFHGNETDGYRYVIGSRSVDMRTLVKEFNAAFSGRGGGKPEMVQGTVRGTSAEIRQWLAEKAEVL